MRRIGAMLSVLAALLLLFDAPAVRAAGGGNPPLICGTSPGCKISGPTINGTVLMDPHTAGSTPTTAGQATVWLGKGSSQASFQVLGDFPLALGCNAELANPIPGTGNPIERFVFTMTNQKNLTDWVPPFVLESLFLPLGITTTPAAPVWPAITQINSARCLPVPSSATNPGWLLMDVTIQFVVPAK
jgi:hypothetical protein